MASFLNKDRSAGRSSNTMTTNSYDPMRAKLTLSTRSLRSTSSLPLADGYTGEETSPQETRRSNARRDTMMSHTSNNSLNKTSHAKLHKRGSSNGSSSPYTSTFPTPYATYEEPMNDTSKSTRSTAATKIKPYLKKSSSTKEDQGIIDLSKSAAENERLAGLGIQQDLSTKLASEVTFVHNRRQKHGRNTSNGSQGSNGSGTYRPGQTFTHPMAKVPQPYTPPTGPSYPSSLDNEEANESDDVVEDEFRVGNAAFRNRRSMSINSTGYANPTPLSQTYTASSMMMAPKHSQSHTDLSMMSSQSDKSKTLRNTDFADPSPPSRTSFDVARSFVSRRSDAEPPSRDELIRAARKKFEEKEASKTQKDEKRRERQRRKSMTESKPRVDGKKDAEQSSSGGSSKQEKKQKSRRKSNAKAGASREDEDRNDERLHAKSYEDYRPANAASLPIYGDAPGESEKKGYILDEKEKKKKPTKSTKTPTADHNWLRFSTWVQTRMLSCGNRN
ncbi:uncharacterized protein MYCGRDRAFT_108975 [Zymoseptoria tritici IPO323]|uniref:Uncharacterized protein n=1 Tax=Zymoseptoria tritici (strain CBS 115943 / IPO323) TaxID=336722 RepID=F9X8T0_ZYMTI|nr:uncharacterized protein MYCGRDRAFT_108975 [Zymoseptoria tritici IPO323]EGP87836.1 hypothetical protein MYCGRDRAFT_108975 [Zymoseptoria tritici IPO323]